MCLIALAHEAHPLFELAVAANRDEFYSRPSAPAAFWEGAPGVLAGRDLRAGGTWLGLTKNGRFAAVTNYREPGRYKQDAPSRGTLVARFLTGREEPEAFAAFLEREGQSYNGFSVIFGSPGLLWHFSNRGGPPELLSPGVHGVSNALMDEPWPKVEKGKRALRDLLDAREPLTAEALLGILSDPEPADEAALPETGVAREVEKALSPIFTRTKEYGTRSSTAFTVDREGRVVFVERVFDADGHEVGRGAFEFTIGGEP